MPLPNDLDRLQQLLLTIPYGKVTTYKALAQALHTRAYRYVGQLLHRNSDPDQFPCCKVVKSNGSLGGYALGVPEKIVRLKKEGIEVKKGKIMNFSYFLFDINKF